MAIKKIGDCTGITGDVSSGRLTRREQTAVLGAQHYVIGAVQTRSKNREKQLLASSCLSVRPPAWNSWSSTGRLVMKFDILYSSKFENSSSIIYDTVTGTLYRDLW